MATSERYSTKFLEYLYNVQTLPQGTGTHERA
jgi:hypothetical protein